MRTTEEREEAYHNGSEAGRTLGDHMDGTSAQDSQGLMREPFLGCLNQEFSFGVSQSIANLLLDRPMARDRKSNPQNGIAGSPRPPNLFNLVKYLGHGLKYMFSTSLYVL